MDASSGLVRAALPRITIEFCTQCKWMLRAAYFAQELLSTFSLSIGEVALQPSTGGTFIITLYTSAQEPREPRQSREQEAPQSQASQGSPGDPQPRAAKPLATVVWDRGRDGGFPETKELKRRVRDVIDPLRDLGHVDRQHGKHQPDPREDLGSAAQLGSSSSAQAPAADGAGEACRDCA